LLSAGTFDVRLNVVEVPEDKTIVFTLAESTFMRNFEGRWQVCHTAVQFPAGVGGLSCVTATVIEMQCSTLGCS
jgi:hypothetical protein